MTSGNASDEPIACDNEEAKRRLANIADHFLFHDRAIENRADDSIAAVIAEPLRSVPYVAPPGFWQAVRDACDAHGALLVFDEVDANVGGEIGRVVGEKMAGIAKHHQVLCVTHLPQIAAFGDEHFTVSKREDGGRTTSGIAPLEGEARVRELAAMITGQKVTETALGAARELSEKAAAWKTGA